MTPSAVAARRQLVLATDIGMGGGIFRGRSVYHCHIIDHEDLGLMGVIEVQ